jgi:Predicted membrane protein
MEGWVLLLVIPAAFTHAIWNYLTKKVGGGSLFIGLVAAVSTVVYLPVVLWIVIKSDMSLNWLQLIWLAISGLWHMIYFCLLEYCYRHGDLSVVYPLTRGSGVLFATICAIFILGERPSIPALIGICLILSGVFVLTRCTETGKSVEINNKRQYFLALICGLTIAAYTMWDKFAVSSLSLNPLVISWCQNFVLFIALLIFNFRERDKVFEHWKVNWPEAMGVGILCPLSYILILIAMTFCQVSYVSPAREFSILIGTFLGRKCLDEAANWWRMVGAGIMVMGIFVLTIG